MRFGKWKVMSVDNIKVDIKQYDGEASIWLRAVESEGFKNILINFWVLQKGEMS